MTTALADAPRRFTFDTVFDGERVIAPARPKRAFGPEEVEAARAAAFAEGERSALARAEAEQARALGEIAGHLRAAFAHVADRVHDHREASARLALACGRAVADAALDRFPEDALTAALGALARELDARPRLILRAAPGQGERLGAALAATADHAGFSGQVGVKEDAALPPAAFALDWGDGRAAFDPVAAAARVGEALETALAAEGLHAEPFMPAEAAP